MKIEPEYPLEPRYKHSGWTTLDEKRVLDYMMDDSRVDSKTTALTLNQKIIRLNGWLDTFKDRKQLKSVDYFECEKHARKLLNVLLIKKGLASETGK